MRITLVIFALFAAQSRVVADESKATTRPADAIPAPAGWKLVWNDEFIGKELDKTKWDFDLTNDMPAGNRRVPGWGNNELEYYTSRPENVFVADGLLHLRAIKETYEKCQYTSARIKTKDRFTKQYGRFEFRAKLPTGKGIWPAIWLLPDKNEYGGWPASGEIDLMEARGQQPEKVLGTIHYGSRGAGHAEGSKDFIFPNRGTIAEFHVYALEWEPEEIRWYVDDQLYETRNSWSSNSTGGRRANAAAVPAQNSWPAPFDKPFYIILNLAVGGQFLGNPDATTPFPATMEIDYVRVYDRVDGYPPIKQHVAEKPPPEKR